MGLGGEVAVGEEADVLVLEDNARTPSGVSYVLENRMVMKKVFPRVFAEAHVVPVDEYPLRLRRALDSVGPAPDDEDSTVVLTPGPYNSAYFEHSFLARRMGVPLVQGSDLFVDDDRVADRRVTNEANEPGRDATGLLAEIAARWEW